MELELNINGVIKSLEVAPNESLLTVLRREGYSSVKHGCETGECGACTVLVDGVARPGCVTLAAQTGGCTLTTAESLVNAHKLHPLQEAFIDTGAIQCGFCTPGMLLSATALLKSNPAPSEEEVREALSGNLCRCTGYAKPVQAVLRAAAVMRGEVVTPISRPASDENGHAPVETESASGLSVAGKSERQIDAVKLVTGKPVFTADNELRGMLYARILTSPHAHAMIREIDASEARALPGVHAVLTYKDVPRVPYNSTGQSEPGPCDQYALDKRVRFVGDRVAVVAAETPEIAEQALKLIAVEYEILPALLDPRLATTTQAPCLHPEPESSHIADANHNVAAQLRADVGDVERGFTQSELIVEGEYVVPQVQQTPLENHTAITYWDEDDRLVVRTSSHVPSQVRQIIAPVIGLPPRRIRVVTSNSGGDFGVKQEMVIEHLCALLTLATDRPVRLEYSRAEEFASSRSRPAQIIRVKTGVKRDGTIVANAMMVLTNTGAYGANALSVQSKTGAQTLPLYPCPNLRFEAQVVYTNLPPASASHGYEGCFALESHLDEIAHQLGIDAIEIRRKNWIKLGEPLMLARELAQDRESREQGLKSCGLPECLKSVEEKVQWTEKRGKGGNSRLRRGVGVALAMHGRASTGQETAGASLKLNNDGSFNLLVESAGSETVIAQIAAEVLGVRIEDIIMHASDTDVTPFATGADASLSGGAAKQVAEQVREQILAAAGQMLKTNPASLIIKDRVVKAPNGQSVTIAQVALHAENQRQIMATASWAGQPLSPSFAAQGAEVEVDTETGAVRVIKAVSAIDAGRVLNPVLAEGQIEGGAAQALGYGICEEMLYDQRGALLTANLSDYRIFSASDMPLMETALVETDEPAGLFGAKEIAEISTDAMAAAVANAVADAIGTRMCQIPLTPERVLRALRGQAQTRG